MQNQSVLEAQKSSFYKLTWALLIAWAIIIFISFLWNYQDCKNRFQHLAILMANTHFDKEKALRLWVASKGGIYVPVTQKDSPNPLLNHVADRDVMAPDRHLTLIPGFHLIRHVREEFPELYKVKGHTVSLNPLRRENEPDEWQRNALISFETGKNEVMEFAAIHGEPYLRLIRPHYALPECLKCHGQQGYKEGDILGGVEISLPVGDFVERQERSRANVLGSHITIFAIGCLGIILGIRGLGRRESDRSNIQQELLESEKKYRYLVESATDIIYQLDRNASFTFLNSTVLNIFGYSEKELIGRSFLDFVSPTHKESASKFITQAMDKTEGGTYFECPFISKSGEVIWLGQNLQTIMAGDQVVGFQAIARDMTDRIRMEESLRNSELRYKSLYSMIRLMCDNVPDLIWAKDMNRNFLFVNRAVCDKLLVASDTDEPIGKNDMFFVQRARVSRPDNPEWHTFGEICINSDEVVMAAMKDGHFEEYGNVRGEFMFLDVNKAPLFAENGEMIGTVGTGRDVTEEMRIKDSLRESEERYRELFEHASDMIYTHDLHGYFNSVNNAVISVLGYQEEEFLRLNFKDILHPDHIPIFMGHFLKKVKDGVEATGPYEVLVNGKDGVPVWLEIKSRLMKQGDRAFGIHGIARNITDRKKLENALLRAQSTYRSVVEAFDGMIHVSSPDHTIEFANQKLVDRTGHNPVGEKCFHIIHGLEDECPWCNYGAEFSEETYRRERLCPKDNRWYYVVNSPFYHEDGRLSRIFLMHDIDVQKKNEIEKENLREQLLQAQKMESIGTLAGGIAHDFNNLLQVIIGFSQMIMMKKDENHRDYANLQKIVQAARSGADLVKRMLAFSRKTKIVPQPLDLNHQIEVAKDLLSRTIPKMIDIQLFLEDGLFTINADPVQMEQIFINLALNSKDAMPEGGILKIETRNVELTAFECSKMIGMKPGRHVLLTVSDTGCGMSQETVEHMFEPFFTTKEAGKGSGLGLSMVYGIVKQHGGSIACNSKVGEGTIFSIYFPVSDFDPGPDLLFGPVVPTVGSETILLVDDEPDLRELGQGILQLSGYSVLTASDGEEALEIYKRQRENISLIILDMMMPRMGGRQCLFELRKIDANVKVLISSGVDSGVVGDTNGKIEGCVLVKKPFDLSEFLVAVRQTLEQGNP